MVESDFRGTIRKLEMKDRPCHYCGKIGHTKFQCKEPRRVKETRCKVCSHNGLETVKQELTCHCPQTKCLERFSGRKELNPLIQENPYLLSVICYDIPTEITNLDDFGKQLMKHFNLGITWNQYSISRPWPKRSSWVRIIFMDQPTRDKFWLTIHTKMWTYNQAYNKMWTYNKATRSWRNNLKLTVGQQSLSLKLKNDFHDEVHKLLDKAHRLKEIFDDVLIDDHASASSLYGLSVSIRRGQYQWIIQDAKSVAKVQKLIEDMDRKPAININNRHLFFV